MGVLEQKCFICLFFNVLKLSNKYHTLFFQSISNILSIQKLSCSLLVKLLFKDNRIKNLLKMNVWKYYASLTLFLIYVCIKGKINSNYKYTYILWNLEKQCPRSFINRIKLSYTYNTCFKNALKYIPVPKMMSTYICALFILKMLDISVS